ncbi:T9SS type A sorting domain-containing protein [Pedobacter arcticus]|uniref:T9SS type A sorting domain-containing protein n=1 Tax=Pedobacter arcticus TaxID=752140 RepID=UPI0002F1115E|nr:T9SS type A sorting domain-containing protein [Pedobacter arcticus]
MKKIYLLMALLLVLLKVNAQIDTTNLAGKYEYIFQQLDRNQIPTGFIDERAFPLFSLAPFDGILTDSNKVNIDTWRGLYFTLSTACLLNQNPFVPITSVNDSIATHNSPTATSIPIAVLFGKYNSVKSYAFSANLLSIVNDQVLDVPNRTENPYLTKFIFAASPAKAQYPDENFSLIFPSDLFYSNSGLTVSALYIDFSDGYGYRSVSWDTAISPTYTSSGDKTLKFKLVVSESVYECYSEIHVDQINNIEPQRYSATITNSVQHFDATSSHSGGNAIIRLSSNNSSGHIKKPLIVVEGYDAFSAAPTLSITNYNYRSLINDFDETNSQGYDFNQALDDTASYDLVFLDYANGTDNIVRNAALLQEVITWVNNQKGSSTEQNVVMGVSMGGLVARYALANMTKNNIVTQTRLLITHDSPHQGANVPIGMQKLAFALGSVDVFGYKIRDVFPSYQEAVDLLNAPATTELLKYRVTSEFSSIANNTFLSSFYKPMVTFSSSNPQPTYRFIATSQGSECGTPLFAPGSNILNIQGSAGALIPLALTTVKASLEINANALPNIGSSATIAKVRFMAKVKLFGFITIAKDFYNYTSNINSSTFLPIDGATGGTSPIGSLDASGTSASGYFPLLYNYSANLNTATISNFCFVPTASALDVQNFNNASLSGVYVNGWSPINPSSAETFIAQEPLSGGGAGTFNESHIRFTARNAEWIFKEMQNSTSNNLICSNNCSPSVNSDLISGASSLCTTPETYSVTNLPTGTSISWSTSPTNIVTSTVNGSSITLTPIHGGYVTLTASLITACGTVAINKPIKVSQPEPYQITNSGNTTSGGIHAELFSHDGYTPKSYEIDSRTRYFEIESTDGTPLQPYRPFDEQISSTQILGGGIVIENFNQSVYLVARYTNECGTSDWKYIYIPYSSYYTYTIYPNPTNQTLTVSRDKQGKENKTTSTPPNNGNANKSFSVSLYNDKATSMYQQKSTKGDDISFDTHNIPNGTYYLHIQEGKTIIKKQIIIEH